MVDTISLKESLLRNVAGFGGLNNYVKSEGRELTILENENNIKKFL